MATALVTILAVLVGAGRYDWRGPLHVKNAGVGLDAEKIVTITIDPAEGFQPHHGRAVAFGLKLKGDLNKQAARIAEQCYNAFIATDMSMLEVNPLIETMDMREAQRSYEANLNVIETSRAMQMRTLDLLKR